MNSTKKITNYLTSHSRFVILFFVIFYAVGIAGMIIPETFSLFKKLIPLAILLSVAAVAFFHHDFSGKAILFFFIIYVLGFTAEVIGVQTGLIFGGYRYGESLGIKLFDTPLLIGINWLLLIYITSSVTERLKISRAAKILLAASLMLLYDFIVEHVAPALDMWHWSENQVPVRNYIAWFVLALLFHTILKNFKIKTTNKIAPVILLCQLCFFAVLWITFNLKS